MRPGLFAIAAFVCLAIAGCGVTNSTPGCGAEETLNLVKEILQREFDAKGTGVVLENSTLEYVITTAHDKELDAYSCSANLMVPTPTGGKGAAAVYVRCSPIGDRSNPICGPGLRTLTQEHLSNSSLDRLRNCGFQHCRGLLQVLDGAGPVQFVVLRFVR